MDRQKLIQDIKDDIDKLEPEFYNIRNKLKHQRRKLLYLTDPNLFYSERYYSKRTRKLRSWQRKIGKALSNEFKITSMVDFGCGIGSFIEGALEGFANKVLGFELVYTHSIKHTPKHIKKYIKHANLGEPINCGKWDCVLSIEVAEHLLEEESDVFVENMINASSRLIILAASWGQNRYHFNPKKREYWIDKFVTRGCKYIDDENDKLYELWDRIGGARYISKWNHLIILSVPGDENG